MGSRFLYNQGEFFYYYNKKKLIVLNNDLIIYVDKPIFVVVDDLLVEDDLLIVVDDLLVTDVDVDESLVSKVSIELSELVDLSDEEISVPPCNLEINNL